MRIVGIRHINFKTVLTLFTGYDERLNISGNSHKLRITFAWFLNLIMSLERDGYMRTFKSGRSRFAKFTEKGQRMRQLLFAVQKVLDEHPKEKS